MEYQALVHSPNYLAYTTAQKITFPTALHILFLIQNFQMHFDTFKRSRGKIANEQEMTITITTIIAFRHFHNIKLQKHF